jgi:hypothetical protein
VRVCGCEVVTAENFGERETVTLEDGGGGGVDAGGGGVVGAGEEVPPPQPIRAKHNRRVATMASNGSRPFVRGMDEERLRTNGIKILHYKYKGNGVGASWPEIRSVTLPLMSRKLACGEEERQASETFYDIVP